MPVPIQTLAAVLISAAGLAPVAAVAQAKGLDLPLAAAFAACLPADLSLVQRTEILTDAGWEPLAADRQDAAAAALAPDFLVVRQGLFLIQPTHDPEVEAEQLDRSAERLLRDWRSHPAVAGRVWRAPSDPVATLELRGDDLPGPCILVADVGAEVLATALAQPAESRPARNPALTITLIGDAPQAQDRITHLSFAPGAFAGRTVLPLIYTPAVRMPD